MTELGAGHQSIDEWGKEERRRLLQDILPWFSWALLAFLPVALVRTVIFRDTWQAWCLTGLLIVGLGNIQLARRWNLNGQTRRSSLLVIWNVICIAVAMPFLVSDLMVLFAMVGLLITLLASVLISATTAYRLALTLVAVAIAMIIFNALDVYSPPEMGGTIELLINLSGYLMTVLIGTQIMVRSQNSTRGILHQLADRTDQLTEANRQLELAFAKQEQVERARRQSENDYHGLFDNAHDAILVFSPHDERILNANPRACELYGRHCSELIGSSLIEISGNAPAGKNHIHATLEKQSAHRFETVQYRSDGSEMILEVNASPVIFQGQEAILSINRDVTARRKMEASLRRSEARYRRLVENAPMGILSINAQGEIVDVNPKLLSMLGSPSASASRRINMLTHPPLIEAGLAADFERCLVSGEPAVHERHYSTLWEQDAFWRYHLTPIQDVDGAIIGLQAIVEDISERKELDLERQRYAADLERSNHDLQHFAYIASHDLQEPLRMVTSYLQLLERRYGDRLDADAADFIAYAVGGAERMHELVDGLLAYSRVGTQGQPLEETDCNMVLAQALSVLKLALEESGATLEHDPLPVIQADPSQLMRLFQNLISNAAKFKSERPPQIHVSAQRYEQAHERGWLFAVQDNGIGISPRHAERIFDIFQRLHTREEYPGTGIGLAICKRIVERHGGRIWVESETGQGATFFFSIPDGN